MCGDGSLGWECIVVGPPVSPHFVRRACGRCGADPAVRVCEKAGRAPPRRTRKNFKKARGLGSPSRSHPPLVPSYTRTPLTPPPVPIPPPRHAHFSTRPTPLHGPGPGLPPRPPSTSSRCRCRPHPACPGRLVGRPGRQGQGQQEPDMRRPADPEQLAVPGVVSDGQSGPGALRTSGPPRGLAGDRRGRPARPTGHAVGPAGRPAGLRPAGRAVQGEISRLVPAGGAWGLRSVHAWRLPDSLFSPPPHTPPHPQESAKSLSAALQVIDEAKSALAIVDDDLRARVRDAVTAEVVEPYEVRRNDGEEKRQGPHPLIQAHSSSHLAQLLLTAAEPAVLKHLRHTAADARALVEAADFFVLRDDAAAGGSAGGGAVSAGGVGGASFTRR